MEPKSRVRDKRSMTFVEAAIAGISPRFTQTLQHLGGHARTSAAVRIA
jgi:hypothetical protein